jgi:hypothetical protein
MSGTLQTAWRVFINGRFNHTAYGVDANNVVDEVKRRLGPTMTAKLDIRVYRANSASD